jgi:hypothetical protein
VKTQRKLTMIQWRQEERWRSVASKRRPETRRSEGGRTSSRLKEKDVE